MEPMDAAYQRFTELFVEIDPKYWETIKSEADVRMKIIDKVFVNVLGWPDQQIHLEEAAGEGAIDYRMAVNGLSRLTRPASATGQQLLRISWLPQSTSITKCQLDSPASSHVSI